MLPATVLSKTTLPYTVPANWAMMGAAVPAAGVAELRTVIEPPKVTSPSICVPLEALKPTDESPDRVRVEPAPVSATGVRLLRVMLPK